VRGGAWNNNTRNLRVSYRNDNEPEERNDNLGFRCVRDEERWCCKLGARPCQSRGGGSAGRVLLFFRPAIRTQAKAQGSNSNEGVRPPSSAHARTAAGSYLFLLL
jgi:hypothetical protein